MRRRVIKLGGSLLDYDGLRSALPRWLAAQTPAANVLVVGGGDLVEDLRRLDRRFHLGEEAAHWLCIRAMGVTARLAAALWPELQFTARWAELVPLCEAGAGTVIFDVEHFLLHHDPHLPGEALEHGWTVTSDSIAARVAEVLGAAELALLKSSLPTFSPLTCRAAAATGYVDPFFPRAAHRLSQIRAVDLRSGKFEERPLRRD